MAIWAMSDWHLAISNPDKSMELFGSAWSDYVARIKEGVENNVKDGDTILMPGDLSWVVYMKDGYEDFKFIDDLPGHKIISRGNHDYFWTTVKKMEEQFASFGISTIEIARNNVLEIEDTLVTGTRGWKLPFDQDFKEEDRKIYDREVIRLGLCMEALNKLDPEHKKKHICMLHYPPLSKAHQNTQFTEILEANGVDLCIYGHLHGKAQRRLFEGYKGNVLYRCVAADYLGFVPLNLDEPYEEIVSEED